VGEMPISISHGFTTSLSTITPASVHQQVNDIVWDNPETLYTSRIPRDVVKKLGYLLRTVRFEEVVEGRIITASWYWEEIIASSIVLNVSLIMQILVEVVKFFPSETANLIAEKNYLFAGEAIQRGWKPVISLNSILKTENNLLKDWRVFIQLQIFLGLRLTGVSSRAKLRAAGRNDFSQLMNHRCAQEASNPISSSCD
jgi:hypothetical protein